jgi:MATE family multidrug resistance protein
MKSVSLDRQIWSLAAPLMLSNISIPLLGIVDTALLGHLDSPQYLGAVSVGSSIMALVLWTFSFLRMGTTGLVAQHIGAGEEQTAGHILIRCIALAILLASGLQALRPLISSAGLVFVGAEADVHGLADNYIAIRFLSAPAVLASYCLTGWLIGSRQTRWVLYSVVGMNCLNIALDYLFIARFGWASEGAAWATVISEYAGALIAFRGATRLFPGWSAEILPALRERGSMLAILSVNRDLMLRTCTLLLCFLFFTSMGARQGNDILAANAILLQLLLLSAFALDAIAHAAETLCGNALGARDNKAFYATCKRTLLWSAAAAILLTLVFTLGRDFIIHGFTSLEDVRATVDNYYLWLCAMPLLAVWSSRLDGIFIGALQTKAMRNSMLSSACLIYLPLWYVFSKVLRYDNHGLWLAFCALMLARGLTLGWAFYRISLRDDWRRFSPSDPAV